MAANDCCRRLQWYELYSTTFRDDIEEEDGNELPYLSREDLLRTEMDADLKIRFPNSSSGSTWSEDESDSQHSGDVSFGVTTFSGILDDDDSVICGGISGDELLAEFGMGRLCVSLLSDGASSSCTTVNDLDQSMDYDEVFSYDFLAPPCFDESPTCGFSTPITRRQSPVTKHQTLQLSTYNQKVLLIENRPN
ncbi:uncharacterized protein LOC117108496 [Anneissia japonica]|uniref:uncharacterized protein LOC117108496 n=1 Tax=Anneissia japonica TaxID=1529436 RepID=UPI001425623A|nr:uncharacterized protein LOC117108496 [Anneissia japonica]